MAYYQPSQELDPQGGGRAKNKVNCAKQLYLSIYTHNLLSSVTERAVHDSTQEQMLMQTLDFIILCTQAMHTFAQWIMMMEITKMSELLIRLAE